MAAVILVLNDGTRLEVDPGAPWTLREQVDWETQFKASFATVYAAIGKEIEAAQIAQQAAEQGETLEEAATQHFRMTWMLWFGWHRLRAQGLVANKYTVFFDKQLADYEFVLPPDEPPETGGDSAGAPADTVAVDPSDPTVSPSPTSPAGTAGETFPATL